MRTVRTTGDLAPLDPCYPLTRGIRSPTVHVRHPKIDRMTLCGRTIGHDIQPFEDAPIGCADCRITRTMIVDRETRGFPELCLAFSRPWPNRSKEQTRCMQPVEGHRLRPDVDYDSPWYDGQELPPAEVD